MKDVVRAFWPPVAVEVLNRALHGFAQADGSLQDVTYADLIAFSITAMVLIWLGWRLAYTQHSYRIAAAVGLIFVGVSFLGVAEMVEFFVVSDVSSVPLKDRVLAFALISPVAIALPLFGVWIGRRANARR